MAKAWTDDDALVEGLADHLFDMIYKLPKYFLHMDELARSYDLTYSTMQILCLLRSGEISIGEISDRLGIAKPNVTPLVEGLCHRGLLERHRSDGDRRKVMVMLLPAGIEMADSIRATICDQMKEWPKDYNVSEMKRLNRALATALEMADDIMARR